MGREARPASMDGREMLVGEAGQVGRWAALADLP